MKWIRNKQEWKGVFIKTCGKNSSGGVYVLPVQLHPSASPGLCHCCCAVNEVLWMHSHEPSCPQCVPLQELQWSHNLFHTSLLHTHVMAFASTCKILPAYLLCFTTGTHCSLLLMSGDLRAGINRFVERSQVSLMCQTAVLWHVPDTSNFAKIFSLQNTH